MAGVWLMARVSARGVGEQGMLEPFGVLGAFLVNGDADWMGDFVFVLLFFFFFFFFFLWWGKWMELRAIRS